jgi:hypothetical protein
MKKILTLLFCLTVVFSVSIADVAQAQSVVQSPIQKDRWMEVDLYWFEKEDMKGSSDLFWSKMRPLFQDISGEKGIILNIGWLMDFVLEWNGSLDTPVPFPKGMTIWEQFKDEGYLLGNTEERIQKWKERFSNAKKRETVTYENWTYRDLKNFIEIFKQSAAQHGIQNIKVGGFVLGWSAIYDGKRSTFIAKHPQSFVGGKFNPTCMLRNDKSHYGAYPDGIPDGLAVTKFFGDQWGDLSKKVGLDAIVLRDSVLGQGVYSRRGPRGQAAPADPSELIKWCGAYADLVRWTKQSNPAALVIGYSNGGAAVGDWRVNCFDLESIAKEGFLDAYIDQSWAGAWNEVGQRPKQFWNYQHMGWTYQLAYILLHGAMLSETPTKHYFLTETFDAWESWNVINSARERLRWGIWAFSHAGIKTPAGIKFPDGSYISWANQAKRLLNEDEINFLKTETNSAFRDLENIKDINGPTLVYSRSAMAWQNANQPAVQMKEWIDDQAGSLMKFGAPILSAARIENLDRVRSEMFIVQTPIHLAAQEKRNLEKLIESGQAVMVLGSPANGVDADILKRIGLFTPDKTLQATRMDGFIDYPAHSIAAGLPRSFLAYQPFSQNRVSGNSGAEVFYSVSRSPALARKKNLILWDAPELRLYASIKNGTVDLPTDELLGSPVPYVLTARLVNEELFKADRFHVSFSDITLPVWCGSWTTKSGNLTVLVADLEEGLEHEGKEIVSFELHLPKKYGQHSLMRGRWRQNRYILQKDTLKHVLRKGESDLLEFGKF